MPRIEEEVDDELRDEVLDDELIEEPPRTKGRPRKQPIRREVPQPKPPAKRYTAFIQQAKEGIADSETREIISESVWEALADIKNDLEEIKNLLGNMLQ